MVHPILLEAGEAVGRGTRSDTVAHRLQTGETETFEDAASMLVEDSFMDSIFKCLMAFYRRFMLLSMGNAQATMFAVVSASIEEASAVAACHSCRAAAQCAVWFTTRAVGCTT